MSFFPLWQRFGLERDPEEMTYEELQVAYKTVIRFETYDRVEVMFQRRVLSQIEHLKKGDPIKVTA